MQQDYQFIDSGNGEKLERFGPITLIRPCSQALWEPTLDQNIWNKADSRFERLPESKWIDRTKIPHNWHVLLKGLTFKIERTSFGHVGLFPEHSEMWDWIKEQIEGNKDFSLLNLFGYSGAATLFGAKCGASVCHLDASKGMVDQAKENAKLNQMEDYPIRWIVDDVFKFLKREVKREKKYDGIILDPPSFGRGSKGEVFKIEKHFPMLLSIVKECLTDKPKFVLVTCHTLGISPIGLKNLMRQIFTDGTIETGELVLTSKTHHLPKGIYAKWICQ